VNKLMVYAISSGVSTHDPGPVTRGLLKDLGWSVGTPPGPTTLISPSGPIDNTKPTTYTWNAVKSSSDYYLWVNGPSGKVFSQWYTAAEANCAGGAVPCSVTSDTTLAIGNYTWWVLTYNSDGLGFWSTPLNFSLGKSTLISPSGRIETNKPTYSWSSVKGAAYYYLWVNGPSGKVFSQWYTAAYANCDNETCWVTADTKLAFGNYTWWILPYSSDYGPWSDPLNFTLGATTLISPLGPIETAKPTYSWGSVKDATHFLLWVNGSSGNVIAQWYEAANANCNELTCWVKPETNLVYGNYNWWIETYSVAGFGPWSDPLNFALGKTTLMSPSGTIDNSKPTYTWSSVKDATHYLLWVNGPSGNVIAQWYTAVNANCNELTCWVKPETTLIYGNYNWWIETYSVTGYGPWSNGMAFTDTVSGI
jgi:hypothetical protein